jgi:hypothetical protein
VSAISIAALLAASDGAGGTRSRGGTSVDRLTARRGGLRGERHAVGGWTGIRGLGHPERSGGRGGRRTFTLRVGLRRDRGPTVGGVERDDNAHGHS